MTDDPLHVDEYWSYLSDDTPNVTWVREMVARKRLSAGDQAATIEDTPAAALRSIRARLWQEITAVVTAYNQAIGREEILSKLSLDGEIRLAKFAYPAGYLDIRADQAAARFVVDVRLRKSESVPEVEHSIEGGWVIRDGTVRLTWFGIETSPGEIVRRILTPFFDEI